MFDRIRYFACFTGPVLPTRVVHLPALAAVSRQRSPGSSFFLQTVILILALHLLPLSVMAAQAATADLLAPTLSQVDREWKFRVFLDDKEIGYHHFFLDENGDSRVLRSVADFEYKLMFIKLYDYEHTNREIWQGDCLAQIDSNTDANGTLFEVSGVLEDKEFIVNGSSGRLDLSGCVMSFAYWNPEFLKQKRLLNTQNGEYLDVEVSSPVTDTLSISGRQQTSFLFHLSAGPLQMKLWYSEDWQWLGLSSETENGRTLRYELL